MAATGAEAASHDDAWGPHRAAAAVGASRARAVAVGLKGVTALTPSGAPNDRATAHALDAVAPQTATRGLKCHRTSKGVATRLKTSKVGGAWTSD